jgi:uncharacterized membrane protein
MPDAVTRWLGRIALTAWLGLIGLTLAWEGWLAPAGYVPPGFWLTIKSVPLLIPLFGLLRERPRAYVVACLLGLPYFIEGVVLSYQHRGADLTLHAILPYALIETMLCVVFLVSAVWYVRRRGGIDEARTHVGD